MSRFEELRLNELLPKNLKHLDTDEIEELKRLLIKKLTEIRSHQDG